jgi:hypothetical protein
MESLNKTMYDTFNYKKLNENLIIRIHPKRPKPKKKSRENVVKFKRKKKYRSYNR